MAAAQDLLGDVGLYAAAVVSGLTDVDAITLSTSQLGNDGRLDPTTGWRLVLLAILSNPGAWEVEPSPGDWRHSVRS